MAYPGMYQRRQPTMFNGNRPFGLSFPDSAPAMAGGEPATAPRMSSTYTPQSSPSISADQDWWQKDPSYSPPGHHSKNFLRSVAQNNGKPDPFPDPSYLITGGGRNAGVIQLPGGSSVQGTGSAPGMISPGGMGGSTPSMFPNGPTAPRPTYDAKQWTEWLKMLKDQRDVYHHGSPEYIAVHGETDDKNAKTAYAAAHQKYLEGLGYQQQAFQAVHAPSPGLPQFGAPAMSGASLPAGVAAPTSPQMHQGPQVSGHLGEPGNWGHPIIDPQTGKLLGHADQAPQLADPTHEMAAPSPQMAFPGGAGGRSGAYDMPNGERMIVDPNGQRVGGAISRGEPMSPTPTGPAMYPRQMLSTAYPNTSPQPTLAPNLPGYPQSQLSVTGGSAIADQMDRQATSAARKPKKRAQAASQPAQQQTAFSDADIAYTAQKKNMTVEEVRRQLGR